MSRTIRNYPWGYFRHPKGGKQAEAAVDTGEAKRRRAIPPNSWDDCLVGRESRIAGDQATKMDKQGVGKEEILRFLMRRFRYSRGEAEAATWHLWRWK